MSREQLVIEYNLISQISAISRELFSLKKFLWNNNRYLHKNLKEEFKQVEEIKKTLTYHIMSSNELYLLKAISILNELEFLINEITKEFKNDLVNRNRTELEKSISELEELQERNDALRVAIEMIEHKKSFFAQ